jgi:hypothetical protein
MIRKRKFDCYATHIANVFRLFLERGLFSATDRFLANTDHLAGILCYFYIFVEINSDL